MSQLFSPYMLGSLELQNRLVMSPMTRNRATDNIPNDLMVEYYRQRSSAGLIVTEGTSPSPNGLGYPRMPGVFSDAQIAGWTPVANAVHEGGAKVFMQVMHTGRISHPLNLLAGARVLAPSALAANEQIYTDAEGMKALPLPEVMSDADIATAVDEFVRAARNALRAGMDGIELHAANGYLLEQFIRPSTNQRTDAYGGPIENRARFVLDVARATSDAIGKEKVGIRLSPYGVFNEMPIHEAMAQDYAYLARQLDALGLVYVHLVDHSSMGAPVVPADIKATFRELFGGTLILSGGYDAATAERDLAQGKADLIGVGRPFLANPDLPARWRSDAPLNEPDYDTFYTPGARGYTDYPALS